MKFRDVVAHKMSLVVIPENSVSGLIGSKRAQNDQKSGFLDFSKKPFLHFFIFLHDVRGHGGS